MIGEEVTEMSANHPVRRAVAVLRAWLMMVAVIMCWNAIVSNPILLHGWVRPLPFWSVAVVAMVWAQRTWSLRIVMWCSSFITVMFTLRALEVFFFADNYNIRARATGISLWVFAAGTTISLGIINMVAISRRSAEEAVWSHKHQSL